MRIRTVGVVRPSAGGPEGGNRVTALRWAARLRQLGRSVLVEAVAPGEEGTAWRRRGCDLLVALHAGKARACALAWARERPGAPLVVACAGTDLYGEGKPGAAELETLRLATRIVVLQPLALEHLPPELRPRARVVYQSVTPPARRPAPSAEAFEVLVVGHLREVKDPLLCARAARGLPASSRVRVRLVGAARDPALGEAARREAARNPRLVLAGELPRAAALEAIAGARLLVSTSRHEGGANVVSEALALDVPIVATRIPGTVGLLGDDHPGLFEVGDEAGLRALLARAEREPAFLERLRAAGRARAGVTEPARERGSWGALLDELEAGGEDGGLAR